MRFPATIVLLAAAAIGQAQEPRSGASAHVMLSPAQLAWGDGPASLPKGARLATLAGDPAQAGPFTFRVRLPAGYRIAPHRHPADEHVTVLEGTYSMGTGEVFDVKSVRDLGPGGFAVVPAARPHFSFTKDGVTLQVHGIGPFVVEYVDPADDPRKTAPAAK